jgi:hypothetical protein
MIKPFLTYLKEAEDMFAHSSRVSSEVEDFNHPLRHLGCGKDDWEMLMNEIHWAVNKVTTDAGMEAALDVLEGQLDEPLVNFFDYLLSGGMKPEGDKFIDGLVKALEDGQRRFGTEPRAAVHGAAMALSRASRAASDADDE